MACQQRSPSREELQREIERPGEGNERLRRKVTEPDEQIADCEKQIADLERQLASRKKDSTNSPKPPSWDGPAAGRRLKPAQAGRATGPSRATPRVGASGAWRSNRTPLPADCRPWDEPLPQEIEAAKPLGEVHGYQVSELLPFRAQIIEYQCYQVACPHCGEGTRAQWPAQAQASTFGPRLA